MLAIDKCRKPSKWSRRELLRSTIGRVLSARRPLAFTRNAVPPPSAAPVLGADTASVLAEVVGLAPTEIRRLRDQRVIG